ncbi:MAG: hypothetical protein N2246_05265 [Candidatus Sumerlaeia bacterium]|nr:hypothetical protein [Candidatus Sumerlaeia bacterium]
MLTKDFIVTMHKIDCLLLIFLFCAGMFLPLIGNVFNIDPGEPLVENRELTPKPTFVFRWSIVKDYPKAFENYFRDHLGFRKTLIRWNNLIYVKLLKISPHPRIVVGKKGWLFVGDELVNYFRGVPAPTLAMLAHRARILEERSHWLAQQNIPLIYIFTAEKSSIYPEFMPSSLNRVDQQSLMDYFTEYLRRYTSVDFIDLRPVLLQAKAKNQLYPRTSSTWNSYGAFIGYREIINHLANKFPALTPLSETDLTATQKPDFGFDLAVLLGLNHILTEPHIVWTPRKMNARRINDIPLKEYQPRRAHFAMETTDDNLPRAVMFRDCFTDELLPFLSENFRRIAYIYQPVIDVSTIHRENPDLVMHELAERALVMKNWKPNPLEVSHTYLSERFNMSQDVRFDIKRNSDRKAIKTKGNISIKPNAAYLQLSVQNKDASIILPLNLQNPASLLIARLELHCSRDTILKLNYKKRLPGKWAGETYISDYFQKIFKISPPKSKYLMEEESFEVELKSGRYTYYIPLTAENLFGAVVLQSITAPNNLEIYALEIRNVPYPHEQITSSNT